MATSSFDRTIVIRDEKAIKIIKEEMNAEKFAEFSISGNKKIKKMSEEKVKELTNKILKKF